jgi:hypothetical protein
MNIFRTLPGSPFSQNGDIAGMPTRHEGLGGVGWSIGIGRGGAQGEISGYREVCHMYIYMYM